MAETDVKCVLTSSNLIDAIQNEQILWDSLLSASEEEKECTWVHTADIFGMSKVADLSRGEMGKSRTFMCVVTDKKWGNRRRPRQDTRKLATLQTNQ